MTANLIAISSVATESDKLPANTIQISAGWKNTDKKTVSAANRTRAIQLPANIWSDISIGVQTAPGTISEETDVAKQLRLLVLDAIADLAKNYLSAICEESNMLRTQVPLADFQLSSLLNWSAEQAALSGRLNGEEIAKWVKESATVIAVTQTHGAPIGKAIGEQFVKLASPNHGLTPEKAAKILANLWNPKDAESTTGLRVQLRLTAISKKTAESANVLDSIL